MTVFLRALWGPFGPFSDEHTGRYSGHHPATQIDWYFFGIREDQSTGRWAVRFEIKTRKWKSINMPMTQWATGAPVVHPDAFIPDKPMVYGATYLDILKLRLSKDDIAFASRLALEAARR